MKSLLCAQIFLYNTKNNIFVDSCMLRYTIYIFVYIPYTEWTVSYALLWCLSRDADFVCINLFYIIFKELITEFYFKSNHAIIVTRCTPCIQMQALVAMKNYLICGKNLFLAMNLRIFTRITCFKKQNPNRICYSYMTWY